ncbi:MAG: DUF2461 family protein [Rhodobiaceae bacterium]|nr:DUF2461 family protein [Rhodobiaceae bacterium]
MKATQRAGRSCAIFRVWRPIWNGWKWSGSRIPPRGFAKDHPHVEDLKRKSFIAMREFGTGEAAGADFISLAAGYYREAAPLNAWISKALGLPF